MSGSSEAKMAYYIPYDVQYQEIMNCIHKDDDIMLMRHLGSSNDLDLINAALYASAEQGRPRCLSSLIALNADVNYWNSSQDETVLGIACGTGHLEITRTLIHMGSEVNRCSGGNLHPPLHSCVKSGSLACAELLVNEKADVNKKDCFNNTALMIACREGRTDMVRYLLLKGAVHTHKNVANNTAFSLASDNGNSGCVRELLRAHPDLASTRTREGVFPLTAAIRHKRGDLVRAFVDSGCDVNCPEAALLTPLHLAIEVEDEDLVRTLAQGGAHLNRPLPLPLSPTPLMVAVAKGSAGLVRTLVEEGADIHAFDSLSRSALYLATKFGYLQCMDALLRGGADPNLYCGPTEDMYSPSFTLPAPTPLHAALIYARDDEAVMLLQAGSDPDMKSLYAQDNGIVTWQPPMHIAHERGMRWAVKLLLRAGSVSLELAESFEDIDSELLLLLQQAHARKYNPPSLKLLTRKAIRTHLGLALFQKVECLGLPWPLQSFLLCGELAFN